MNSGDISYISTIEEINEVLGFFMAVVLFLSLIKANLSSPPFLKIWPYHDPRFDEDNCGSLLS